MKRGVTMTFNEFINSRRKELNMTIDELVALSGLPKGTVSKITSGENTNPKLHTTVAICRALRCSIDSATGTVTPENGALSRNEAELVSRYRMLDHYGKNMIQAVMELETERCLPTIRMISRPYYPLPVSAGHGNPLDESTREEREITDTPEHRRGDFLLRVSGDSMQPMFRNGDLVLVKRQETVEIGEIGIFVLNGESFIKKHGVNELISLNPHYHPKAYGSSDTILCCGKVLCNMGSDNP